MTYENMFKLMESGYEDSFLESVLDVIRSDDRFRLISLTPLLPKLVGQPVAWKLCVETEHTKRTSWELWIHIYEGSLTYWIKDVKWSRHSNLPWRGMRETKDFDQVREDFLRVRYVEPDDVTEEELAEIEEIMRSLEDSDE
jgi:hypothetical protein